VAVKAFFVVFCEESVARFPPTRPLQLPSTDPFPGTDIAFVVQISDLKLFLSSVSFKNLLNTKYIL
jgi:hypothetical protein